MRHYGALIVSRRTQMKYLSIHLVGTFTICDLCYTVSGVPYERRNLSFVRSNLLLINFGATELRLTGIFCRAVSRFFSHNNAANAKCYVHSGKNFHFLV